MRIPNCSKRNRDLNVLWVAFLTGAIGLSQTGTPIASAWPGNPAETLKLKGKDASLTVLPVGLAGHPSTQVGEVLGMMLERAGMINLQIGSVIFSPPGKADLAQSAASLSEFVRVNPLETEFALFADFLGTPGKSVSEVRGVIVNKQGEVLWQDRQTPSDADFKRLKPAEPMDCCVLIVERLRPVLNLDSPERQGATKGTLAKQWEQKTGVPDESERAAMKTRQEVFRRAAPTATLAVYPVRAAGQPNAESAKRLAELFNKAELIKAEALSEGPRFDIKGNMNEQKVLWDMAHAFREHLKAHPPEANYALFAEYLMGKSAVGAVHFAVCDRDGQWVIVDFQNSHWADFKAIEPKSVEDCDRLVVKRLESYSK